MKCAVLSLLVASVTGQLTLPTGGNTNGRNNNGRTTTTATTANGVTTTTTFVTSGRDSGQSVPMAISFGNGAGQRVGLKRVFSVKDSIACRPLFFITGSPYCMILHTICTNQSIEYIQFGEPF